MSVGGREFLRWGSRRLVYSVVVVSGRGDCEGEELYLSLLCPQVYVAPPTSCVQTVTGYLLLCLPIVSDLRLTC